MIRFAFYGRLADVTGRERVLEAPKTPLTVGEAVALLSADDDDLRAALAATRVNFALNDRIVGVDQPVAPGDEIAVLPPFSGG